MTWNNFRSDLRSENRQGRSRNIPDRRVWIITQDKGKRIIIGVRQQAGGVKDSRKWSTLVIVGLGKAVFVIVGRRKDVSMNVETYLKG